MESPPEIARLLAESLSELVNCAEPLSKITDTPPIEAREELFDAADSALRVYSVGGEVRGPHEIDLPAVFTIVAALRDALPDKEPERVCDLCRALLRAMHLPG